MRQNHYQHRGKDKVIEQSCLIILEVIEKAKNVDEKIDEIEVKRNGAHDVLIRRKAFVDHVCILDNIAAEEEASSNCENEVHGTAEWHEYAN